MNFLKRQTFCERLSVNLQQSYRLLEHGQYGALISSDAVIAILNNARRGGLGIVTYIPSNIVTAKQIVEDPDFAGSDISEHDLLVWGNRRINPLPHFRINKQIRRYQKDVVVAWLKERTIGRKTA